MKTSFKYFFFLFGLSLFVACNNAPKGEKVESGEAVVETTAGVSKDAVTYAVNADKSYINWVGGDLVGKKHTGSLSLKSGELTVAGGQVTGGSFVLDMTSIENKDLEGESKAKLEGHLKSGDFFEAGKYPTGEFVITKVEVANDSASKATHNITGNLTMKDITKSITIPANIAVAQSELSAITPSFVIDRTEWDVMFRAGVLGTAKDKIIKDEIALQIMLIASPRKGMAAPAEDEATSE